MDDNAELSPQPLIGQTSLFHKAHRPNRSEHLINQNNPHYKELRARANEEGEAAGRCFEESRRAYEAKDHARAKQRSEEGNVHKRESEKLNAQASDWIFEENNKNKSPDEVDLHGLYVREAKTRAKSAIQRAQSRGDSRISFIVGKGLHSPENDCKLKPAIEELVKGYDDLSCHVDEHNSGVLVVSLASDRREHIVAGDHVARDSVRQAYLPSEHEGRTARVTPLLRTPQTRLGAGDQREPVVAGDHVAQGFLRQLYLPSTHKGRTARVPPLLPQFTTPALSTERPRQEEYVRYVIPAPPPRPSEDNNGSQGNNGAKAILLKLLLVGIFMLGIWKLNVTLACGAYACTAV